MKKKQSNGASQEAEQPSIQLQDQFVKRCFFERNELVGQATEQPRLGINVDVEYTNQNDTYEIDLIMKVEVLQNETSCATLNLIYTSVFVFNNISADMEERIVMVECPKQVFPYVQRIVSDMARDAGLNVRVPALNFVQLYQAKMQQKEGGDTTTTDESTKN